MEAVPSRSYRLNVRPYPVEHEDVKRPLEQLKERHQLHCLVYRLVLESGARFEHVLRMLESWKPEERVEIPGTSIVTRRLVCLRERGVLPLLYGFEGGD